MAGSPEFGSSREVTTRQVEQLTDYRNQRINIATEISAGATVNPDLTRSFGESQTLDSFEPTSENLDNVSKIITGASISSFSHDFELRSDSFISQIILNTAALFQGSESRVACFDEATSELFNSIRPVIDGINKGTDLSEIRVDDDLKFGPQGALNILLGLSRIFDVLLALDPKKHKNLITFGFGERVSMVLMKPGAQPAAKPEPAPATAPPVTSTQAPIPDDLQPGAPMPGESLEALAKLEPFDQLRHLELGQKDVKIPKKNGPRTIFFEDDSLGMVFNFYVRKLQQDKDANIDIIKKSGQEHILLQGYDEEFDKQMNLEFDIERITAKDGGEYFEDKMRVFFTEHAQRILEKARKDGDEAKAKQIKDLLSNLGAVPIIPVAPPPPDHKETTPEVASRWQEISSINDLRAKIDSGEKIAILIDYEGCGPSKAVRNYWQDKDMRGFTTFNIKARSKGQMRQKLGGTDPDGFFDQSKISGNEVPALLLIQKKPGQSNAESIIHHAVGSSDCAEGTRRFIENDLNA